MLVIFNSTDDKSNIPRYTNHDVNNIVTPINVDKFERLLINSKYDKAETEFLIKGFREGFNIGYEDPRIRKDQASNIPFGEVGDKFDMWVKTDERS